eukprot:3265352-Alexandrium_andersonii.AAC.1
MPKHPRLLLRPSQMRGGLAPPAALSPARAASAGASPRLPSPPCGQPKRPAGPSWCPPCLPAPAAP